jgi:nucleotide-binding universal stress UspA family protein
METAATAPRLRATSARAHLSRIAAGIDGLPEGMDAATLAGTLADVVGADLMLVGVLSDPLILPPGAVNWRELRTEAQATLHRARGELASHARTTLETDFSVPRALHRVVHRHHRDLLVLGSSRRGPQGRVRIGTRTRQLLGWFEYPLAIAPRGFSKHGRVRFARIGVGYDAGPEAQAALELAAYLALAAGAELEIDAVVNDQPPPLGWSRFARGGADHSRWEDAVLAELEKRRAEAEAAAKATGAATQVEVKRGRPADVLLELSESVDLLVIGSRRWGPVSRLLLGSTGEALLHDAACPVLVVPRPAA